MYWLRRGAILLTVLLAASFIAWCVPRALNPSKVSPEKRARDSLWINSSPYFWDRQVCRWMSICGLHHLRRDPAARPNPNAVSIDDDLWGELRRRADSNQPRSWEESDASEASGRAASRRVGLKRNPRERRRILKDIPDYVLEHAPLVHLYSGEQFWPSDMREHVEHMKVTVDNVFLNTTDQWTLDNLQRLNQREGTVVLHSNDDVESRPEWLHSHYNKPNPFPDGGGDGGKEPPTSNGDSDPDARREPTTWFDVDKDRHLHRIADPRSRYLRHQRPRSVDQPGQPRQPRISPRGHKPDANGYSQAPAVLILVDKGSGIVDAFWFFFYSYNLGQTVLGIRFGNHVGDWEHCMVRFENGEPRGLFFSEHEGGQAYAWGAVEKRGDRPVIYSAVGSHAMYPLPGDHPYIIPFRLLKDVTDRGPLWDPALNNYAYHYDYTRDKREDTKEPDVEEEEPDDTHSLVPAASNPNAPTSWFHYRGRWGDQVYSLADVRQWRLFGQYHYVTGPSGPKFKRLYRSELCQSVKCRILYKLDPKRTWY
ncbi:vacuolar protein sorting-associated protein TDA6 [Tolypocladium capitatum]|uniref:Vacuolar protein sorting-associated protein TDA6 n=1 Tax=Tolypocladium capitatum TaxID=45235 RepID=A0A2K3QF67_9HYPO|nr:vacuolar protein sorting-associated protein TDA6 [Tolypocladium capitatum]